MGVYLVTNITDTSNDPKTIYIDDIPNRRAIDIAPGKTVDLETLSTRNQILESLQIRAHLEEGRITVDTLGTVPRDRLYVDAEITAQTIDVQLAEPVKVSAEIEGSETLLTGTATEGKKPLDVYPIYPSTPTVQNITIPNANQEYQINLPIDTKRFLVRVREFDTEAYLGFQSGGDTIIIRRGTTFLEENIDASSLALYLSLEKSSRTVEILSWAHSS